MHELFEFSDHKALDLDFKFPSGVVCWAQNIKFVFAKELRDKHVLEIATVPAL